jgi:hypothetical protein
MISKDTLLVLENGGTRTARIFEADLSGGKRLLATSSNDGKEDNRLNVSGDASSEEFIPMRKKLIADLSSISEIPDKLEGLAVLDSTTFAIVNDNDFEFDGIRKDGKTLRSGKKSHLIILRSPKSLK